MSVPVSAVAVIILGMIAIVFAYSRTEKSEVADMTATAQFDFAHASKGDRLVWRFIISDRLDADQFFSSVAAFLGQQAEPITISAANAFIADYQDDRRRLARAYALRAYALLRMNNTAEAIRSFQKGLLIHRGCELANAGLNEIADREIGNTIPQPATASVTPHGQTAIAFGR
jgi:hypothetical protein